MPLFDVWLFSDYFDILFSIYDLYITAVNKFSPAANTYDIGTTIGKAPAISISGREKEPAECKVN